MWFLAGFPKEIDSLKKDLLSGLTVAIVALPLAIGFGVTSGMTPAAGIATAVVAGFLTALFGSSRFQVSGPTGAMAVVLIPVIHTYGVGAIPIIGLLSGALIFLMAIFRLGNLINHIPDDVVEGFTLGIAAIIAIQQIPLALDISKGEGDRTIPTAINTLANLDINNLSYATLFILAITLFIKFNLVHLIRKMKINWYVPASFVSIAIATLLAHIFKLNVAQIGDIPQNIFKISEVSLENWTLFLTPSISVALLAAIESLLAAKVADSLANVPEDSKFDPNKELIGQSIGSTFASIVGGMPATGAIARTNVNVRAHGQTKLAAMTHAVVLLVISLFAGSIFGLIPSAAIAGVLVGTSFRIMNIKIIGRLWIANKNKFFVFMTTALVTVAIDLIWGIVIGLLADMATKKLARSEK